MSDKVKLYLLSGSPPAWRIVLYLEYRGIPYEAKVLSYEKGETKTEEFLKMNPRGKVPTLDDNGIYVYESLAIIDYLEAKYKDDKTLKQVFPDDLKKRAVVSTRGHVVAANFHFPGLYTVLFKEPHEWDMEALKKDGDGAIQELRNCDQWLASSKYAGGDEFSYADIILLPFLGLLKRGGLCFSDIGCSNLEEYYKRIEKEEFWQKSIPPHYKTTPSHNKFAEFFKKVLEMNK